MADINELIKETDKEENMKYLLTGINRKTWGKFKALCFKIEGMQAASRLRNFIIQYVEKHDTPAPIVKPVKAERVYPTPAPKPATAEPEYSENLDDI